MEILKASKREREMRCKIETFQFWFPAAAKRRAFVWQFLIILVFVSRVIVNERERKEKKKKKPKSAASV